MKSESNRLPELDGLRALAVIGVLLIHHGLLSNGVYGVDLFFVLSGFLITGILRNQRSEPEYWRPFYLKRITRIVPPVILLIFLVSLSEHHFRPDSLWYLFFASNFAKVTRHAVNALDPLWSLAVEEHFYLVWPFAVRYLERRRLLALSAGIVALSPIVRGVGTLLFHRMYGLHDGWDNPISLFTPFRLDGLALGSLLALLVEQTSPRALLKQWSGRAALGTIAVFVGLESAFHSFRRGADSVAFNTFGYSLVSLAAFWVVAFVVLNPQAIASRLLRWKPLVYVGTVSYGIYLLQGLVVGATRQLTHTPRGHENRLIGLDFALVVAVASLSYYVMEKPIIRWGKALARARRTEPVPAGDLVSSEAN